MPQRVLPAFFLLALLLLAPAQPVRAQESGMPSEIEWKLAELGAVINPPETAKLYAPLQETEPYQGIKVTRDLKYGTDERHALDIFAPEQASAAPRAVLIYVHGGAFIGGNKRAPGSPFYDNIMLFAARNGFIGVNVTYRLAPQHRWPAGAEDVAAAVRWVATNIAAHGGDPARVFLMGHSAGAVHVASYVAHSKFHGPRGIGLSGAILLSGLYDSPSSRRGRKRPIWARTTPSAPRPRRWRCCRRRGSDCWWFMASSIRPNSSSRRSFSTARSAEANRCSSLLTLPKHTHMSMVYAINTKDRVLSDEIVAFVKGGK